MLCLTLQCLIHVQILDTFYIYIAGVTVTVYRYPAGRPVSGSANTLEYPILSSVALLCVVMQNHGISFSVTSYQWNTTECYANNNYNDGVPGCFPHGQATQFVTENSLTAEDSGTIACTVTIDNTTYTMTSETFTLRISGKLLWYTYMVAN